MFVTRPNTLFYQVKLNLNLNNTWIDPFLFCLRHNDVRQNRPNLRNIQDYVFSETQKFHK